MGWAGGLEKKRASIEGTGRGRLKKPKLFFEAFVTGDDTPGRSNSGLGLSVAKDLLNRMKLKITAKPDREKVTFEIRKK